MMFTTFGRVTRGLARVLTLATAIAFAAPVFAANYPLELVSPRAAGSSPSSDSGTPAMPSGHRIFRAYPGIEYNIRAVVIAGEYPYSFQLSSAPSGMTIDTASGEITWINPQANATPTIRVTDAEGTQRSSSWTIVVGTSGFRFVDSVRGSDSNAGTLTAPWATLAKVKSSGSAADIVYFRNGVYTTVGMATGNTASSPFNPPGNWQGVDFDGGSNPVKFLAYPGETPIYDGGHVAGVSQGNILKLGGSSSDPVYFEGFALRNMWHMGMQFYSGSCDYPVFRNLAFNGPYVGVDGSNSSGIMTVASLTDPTYYGAYQKISQVNGGPGLIKHYSHKKNLWEDCSIRNSAYGPDQKMHVPRFEIRRCTITTTASNDQGGLYGNMQHGSGGGETSSGEIRFNLIDRRNVSDTAVALDLNQNADSGVMHVYRNTFLGRVQVRFADSADGPFRFYNNVIVNNDSGTPAGSHISQYNVTVPSRISVLDNLVGFPSTNIVDSSGLLTAAFSQYLGTRGHQIGPGNVPPSPPGNVIVE